MIENCATKYIRMNFNQVFPVAVSIQIKQENIATQRIFNCGFCNQTFRTKKDLKDHKQRQHQFINIKAQPRTKKSKAQDQSQSFTSNYVPHQPKFQCEYCFKGFDQSHRLKQHQISHREVNKLHIDIHIHSNMFIHLATLRV